MLAKQKVMNEKSSLQNHAPGGLAQRTRVTRLLRRIRDCLQNARGECPTYAELEEWTQTAHGTIKDWFNDKARPSAEFLLQLLERVPERVRPETINSVLRLWPSLEHPRLNCESTVISLLKTIVCQPHGLVLVQGGSDESRTFMATALGHAFLDLTARPHRLSGIDIHEPDWFVPLPGVRYLHNLFQPAKLVEAVKAHWPTGPAVEAQLVVFNGLETVTVQFRNQLKSLSAQCAVIVAEGGSIKPSLLKRCSAGPIHIISVSEHPEDTKGIAVIVEAI